MNMSIMKASTIPETNMFYGDTLTHGIIGSKPAKETTDRSSVRDITTLLLRSATSISLHRPEQIAQLGRLRGFSFAQKEFAV